MGTYGTTSSLPRGRSGSIERGRAHCVLALSWHRERQWVASQYAGAQCGHCKRLEETWEKLATKLGEDRESGEVVPIIAKVDGTMEKALSGPQCRVHARGVVVFVGRWRHLSSDKGTLGRERWEARLVEPTV